MPGMRGAQLSLFNVESAFAQRPAQVHLNSVVCWTRMQAESGEQLQAIIQRKEAERRAGKGLFFWGIGNPVTVPDVTAPSEEIPVIFSKMLSRPQHQDASPTAILIWRKYATSHGIVELPDHALVTSRAHTKTGAKRRHFALVCRSKDELRLARRRSFDPAAYRNPSGQEIGFSQVTAFVRLIGTETSATKYAVDMEAALVAPYVVQLLDPVLMQSGAHIDGSEAARDDKSWKAFVKQLRAGA